MPANTIKSIRFLFMVFLFRAKVLHPLIGSIEKVTETEKIEVETEKKRLNRL
jgi:hypothetical protein